MTKVLPYLSYQQVADELDCSMRHVQRMVQRKGIRVYFFGGKALVKVEDIISEIEENKRAESLQKLTVQAK